MKKIILILFFGIMMTACSDEGGNFLNYDGNNFSAPFLPTGTHTVGAKFDANLLDAYIGRQLLEIQFYMVNVPDNAIIEVFGQGTSNIPGSTIMSADIGSNMASQSWNTYILDNPIEITGEDVWICLTITHNKEDNTIGCDPGPASANGDWIRPDGSQVFETFRAYTLGETSINWNIRGVLDEG